MQTFGQAFFRFRVYISSLGIRPGMEEFEKRKMSIFNFLNVIGMAAGLTVALIGLLANEHLPPLAWFVACSPVAVGIFVLWLNHEEYYEASRLLYFSLYPLITCVVYLGEVDLGIDLFFLLYCVMSVFFLQRMISMVFSFLWSTICYAFAVVAPHHFYFRLAVENYWFYVFNHLLALGFIFYALYLMKKENSGYQQGLVEAGTALHRRNEEVELQRQEIAEKARMLEQQTRELTELNQVKNKLFSIIAHDLKTPMYALRNMFNHMQQQQLPGKEMHEMVPGIATEMNYVTSLIDNLLQWARSQMKNEATAPEVLELQSMVRDVLHLMKLQASNKQVYIEEKVREPMYCYADREMVNLVLRNLLSNAIKFTPSNGKVLVTAAERSSFVEIYVQDTGVGMDSNQLQLLFSELYYTTNGTNSESGTGLGLKLCKEFLEKNGGHLSVESQKGKGTTFSFTLPKYETSSDN